MLEEGTFSDFYHKARKKVLKKKEEMKKYKVGDPVKAKIISISF